MGYYEMFQKQGGNWVKVGDSRAPSAIAWGNIIGTLADQTDLNTKFTDVQEDIDAKLPLAGGTLTGALVFDSASNQHMSGGSDSRSITLYGGTYGNGSFLILDGSDARTTEEETHPHTFILGTTGWYRLVGSSDGLTWTGKQVLTTDDIINNVTSTSITDALSANQGKALKEAVDDKLPLAGGTLTGILTFDTSSTNCIVKGSADSALNICGGTNGNGGQLVLRGQSRSSEAGYAKLVASTVSGTTTTSSILQVKPSGNLTLDGNNIPVLKSKSITATTTSTGAWSLGLSSNQVPLYITFSSSGQNTYMYYFRAGQGYAVISTHDSSTGTIRPVTNASLTGTLYYLEWVS